MKTPTQSLTVPTHLVLAIIVAQWLLIFFLLYRGAGMSDTTAAPTRPPPESLQYFDSSTRSTVMDQRAKTPPVPPPLGVFVTVLFKAPKWFHLRYVAMFHNALSNLPNGWQLQVFLNRPWVAANIPPYHPGWRRILQDPRVTIFDLPERLLGRKPKYVYVDPWFWKNMLADRVVLFSGNGAFCGNTVYNYEWLDDFDFVGAPFYAFNGVGGSGETHSYRNRSTMLTVLEHAMNRQVDVGGSSEYEFFIKTMLELNKEKPLLNSFRLASPSETFKFGGVVNLTDKSTLLHLPLVVSGTLARLSYEERDAVLKHCSEVKLIFPSLHEPACFGAHPNAGQCRKSICALQDNVPTHGC